MRNAVLGSWTRTGLAAVVLVLILGSIAVLGANGQLSYLRYLNIPLIHPWPPAGNYQNPFNPTDRGDIINASQAAKVKSDLGEDGQVELKAYQASDGSLLDGADTGNRLVKLRAALVQNHAAGVSEDFTNQLTSIRVGKLADPNDAAVTWCVAEVGTSRLTLGNAAAAATQPTGSGTTSAAPSYVYRTVPGNSVPGACPTQNTGLISNPCAGLPTSACPPAQTGYYVYDSNGNALGLVCVPNPADSLLPPTTPEIALADQASSRQPWPALALGITPRAGLTGLPSWFRLSGSAAMPDAVASSGPLTVRVQARLAGVSWEFGDGLGFDSVDLGQSYPVQSDIQHLYQTDTYRLANGYRVVAILRYLVTYSVNGGSWNTLGVKTRPFSQQYLVYQLQPEAVAGQ